MGSYKQYEQTSSIDFSLFIPSHTQYEIQASKSDASTWMFTFDIAKELSMIRFLAFALMGFVISCIPFQSPNVSAGHPPRPRRTTYTVKVYNHTNHSIVADCNGITGHWIGRLHRHGSTYRARRHIFRFRSLRRSLRMDCIAWNRHGKVVGQINVTIPRTHHHKVWNIRPAHNHEH